MHYTRETFIEKASKLYNNYYDYSKVIYTKLDSNILITCPVHGDFYVNAHRHIHSNTCCKQCNYVHKYNKYLETGKNRPNPSGDARIDRLNKFIHPNLTIIGKYISAKDDIEVIDTEGIRYSFFVPTLLKGKFPCKKCIINKTFAFNLSFKKLHPDLTLVGEYVNSATKILVKDSLDVTYAIPPADLNKGVGPDIRNAIDKNECFAKRAKLVHGDKYKYDKVNYTGAYNKVLIYCNGHNDYFLQQASQHLNGSNCPKCSLKIGYKRSQFIKYCDNPLKVTNPIVYIIRCFNETENFLKIGITTRSISRRFFDTLRMPYSYEVIKEIKGSPDFVWDKERELHKLCRNFQYNPLIPFGGDTECFNLECLNLLNI